MPKKKERQDIPTPPLEKLGALIIVIYFVIFAALTACYIAAEKQALIPEPDPLRPPHLEWFFLVPVVYYVLPFLLGAGFGLTFKPFWRNFRNVTVIIFIVHFLFSALVATARIQAPAAYAEKVAAASRWAVFKFDWLGQYPEGE